MRWRHVEPFDLVSVERADTDHEVIVDGDPRVELRELCSEALGHVLFGEQRARRVVDAGHALYARVNDGAATGRVASCERSDAHDELRSSLGTVRVCAQSISIEASQRARPSIAPALCVRSREA
jgi:hypothetical protein